MVMIAGRILILNECLCKESPYRIVSTARVAAVERDASFPHCHFRASADYTEAHYAEQITLSDLAHVAELSEGYLCRLFSQYFHARPIAYLNRLRIQKAKAMLNRSYLSVESVAEVCGVENPSNFTKLFRQTEGITPSAYRNMVNI